MAKKKKVEDEIMDKIQNPEVPVTEKPPEIDSKEALKANLQDIKEGVTDIKKKSPGRITKTMKLAEEQAKTAASDIENKAIITSLIMSIDEELKVYALKPISDGQKQILTIGCMGIMRKYNFTLDAFPEVTAGAAVVWIGYDKFRELEDMKKREADLKGVDVDEKINGYSDESTAGK